MSNSFLQSPRFRQSLNAIPHHDAILRNVLGAYNIRRTEDHVEHADSYLKALYDDRHHGIDGTFAVRGTSGMSMSFSEKHLSYEQARHNSITIEKYNDSEAKTQGDWQTIRAELYLVSYANEDASGLDRWMLLDMAALKIAISRSGRVWHEACNSKLGARASFCWLEANRVFEDAPFAVLAQSGMLSEANVARLVELQRLRNPYWLEDDEAA